MSDANKPATDQNSDTFRKVAELVVKVLWFIAKLTKNKIDDLVVKIIAAILGVKLEE